MADGALFLERPDLGCADCGSAAFAAVRGSAAFAAVRLSWRPRRLIQHAPVKLIGKMVMEERHIHLREVGAGKLLNTVRGSSSSISLDTRLIKCGNKAMNGSSSGDGRFHLKKATGKVE